MIKRILLCALCLVFVCLGFGCEKEPNFGEEGGWYCSEKLFFDMGGNENGLTLEEYIARANEATKDWPDGMTCLIKLNVDLILKESEYAFEDEALNAFLTRVKKHELLIREAYGLPETGEIDTSVRENKNYLWDVRALVCYAYGSFLEIRELDGFCTEAYSDCLTAKFSQIPDDLTAALTDLSQSPLVELIDIRHKPQLSSDFM